MRKEKEKIKAQIIKSLEAYKGKIGFDFFESSNSISKTEVVKLDENDTEVLLMNLTDSSWILLTTKCLFIWRNDSETRIDGVDIIKFEFLNLANGRSKEKAAEFKNPGEYKSWLYSGDFRIVRNNSTEVIVILPHHDFGFCLFNAIKKLQFVTKKYEGI
jgi:hypothetical protein